MFTLPSLLATFVFHDHVKRQYPWTLILTLCTVLVPTDVTRVNCVFEQNDGLMHREQFCALWLPRNIALDVNLKKNEFHYFNKVEKGVGHFYKQSYMCVQPRWSK